MRDWFKHWFDEDYATLYAHRDEPEARRGVNMALAAAPELGSGPVLDLACGSGRHLIVLRKSNPMAFGADLSAPLLRGAPVELRPWLIRADMRQLPVKAGSLGGITLWFTPFGYFEDAENQALLHHLAGLLIPGGILFLDYLNQAQVISSLVPEDTVERHGLRVRSRRHLEGSRVLKRMAITRLDTGERRDVTESVRLYSPEEMTQLLEQAGFKLRKVLGDYEGGAWSPSSPRWIAVAVRR